MIGLDLGNLLIHIRGDDAHLDRVLRRSGVRVNRFAADVDRAVGKAAKMMGAAALIAAGASVKAFASFDDAMTRSTAIMSGVTKEMDERMRKLAITMSRQGVQSAAQLAESYFFLASAGLDVQQSMAALPAVQQFATAGAFDMARATDLLTDAQSALGLTVDDAQTNLANMQRVSDVFVGANTLANASTEQFSMALTSQAGPAMKAYGIQLEEGVAVLAAYADQGIKAENAGNMFSRMLRLMTKGFQDNRGAWAKFNIDIYDVAGNLKPLATIVKDLTGAVGNLSTEQKVAALDMLGFQARSQQAILPLLGLSASIATYKEQLEGMAGITQEVADKQLKSFGSALKITWNNVKAVGLMFGEIISEGMPAFQHFFSSLTDWMMANESTFRSWAAAVVDNIKSVVDYLLDVQKGLEKILPSGVSDIAKNQAKFEYELRMGQKGKDPYKTSFRKSTRASMGMGAASGMGSQMIATTTRANETLYQQILAKAIKDTQRSFNDVQNEWDLGYKNAVDTAEASYKRIEEAQAIGLSLPDKFPENLVGALGEVGDAAETTGDHVEAYRSLLGEMGRMSEAVYIKQQEHLKELAKEYAAVGVEVQTINLWLEEQQDLLKIEFLKQDGWIDGLVAYQMQVQRTMKTAGEKAFEFAESMEQSIAGALTNLTKDFENWKDHVKQLLREVYNEAIRIAFIQPAAASMASGLTSIIASLSSPSASAGTVGTQGPTGMGYADGGVAWYPQKAWVGEKEPELIAPLSKLAGMFGGTQVNVINESGHSLSVSRQEEYMMSDQRVLDVVVQGEKTNRKMKSSLGTNR